VNQSLQTWYWIILGLFDRLVGLVGVDIVFLLSIMSVAAGVQFSCLGTKKRKALLTSVGLTLTGMVALGQGAELMAIIMTGRVALRSWWWMTGWLVLVASAALVAQFVQHVQVVQYQRRCAF
jgi:hypothetical protein